MASSCASGALATAAAAGAEPVALAVGRSCAGQVSDCLCCCLRVQSAQTAEHLRGSSVRVPLVHQTQGVIPQVVVDILIPLAHLLSLLSFPRQSS